MKISYTRIVGSLAVLLLVVSFLVPAKLASPTPVEADPGLMEWTIVDTPDSEANQTKQLHTPWENGTELIKLAVGNNGSFMYVLSRERAYTTPTKTEGVNYGILLYKSVNGGVSWFNSPSRALAAAAAANGHVTNMYEMIVWDMALAPDDFNLLIVAISDKDTPEDQYVYITTDGGTKWEDTNWAEPDAEDNLISTMDVSMEYGSRDILVGTRDGTGADTNNLQTMRIPGYGGWTPQTMPAAGDVIVAKFSPTYVGDSTIAVVYSDADSTELMTGSHDLSTNVTTWQAAGLHVEIKNAASAQNDSPDVDEIITADMDLPSDFSGQSASLRRFYISTDAIDDGVSDPAKPDRGVYRVDDNVIYTLMDNTTTFATAAVDQPNRRAHSIAYWGTYASGKLLVGETLGRVCEAAVPTWFTDSPTVCPVPCWYPAKKPASGAAGWDAAGCGPDQYSWGNAWVEWSPTYADQGVAYVVTASSKLDAAFNVPVTGDFDDTENDAAAGWPSGYANVIYHDESAFQLTRNNGETWNQLALIDTLMSKLTDVAPSADCSTVYLASVNNDTYCKGFDSIWRSSINENVVAPPLPALPIGQIWERVRVTPTYTTCNHTESNYIIIRLAPDKLDGQVVFWAAGGGTGLLDHSAANIAFTPGANTQKLEWSPDYGDYFANVNPRIAVQDMEAESSTILYVMATNGSVQKLPYTGTAWSSAIDTVSSKGGGGHTIDVQAEGIIFTGAGATSPYPAAISTNGASSFIPMVRPTTGDTPQIGYHALLDTDYADNETVYLASDGGNDENAAASRIWTGKVWRNKAPSGSNTDWTDMCAYAAAPVYGTLHRGYFGLAQSNSLNVSNQGTLYAAHAAGPPNAVDEDTDPDTYWCGVERTLGPLNGIPKPGVFWDCMDAYTLFRYNNNLTNGAIDFTLEPKSLKICGCLTQDTYSELWAIDNDWYADNHNALTHHGGVAAVRDRGMLWAYTDCIAKVGPTLTMEDGTIIGCDPATGRNQEVNFTWEQLCIADEYDIQISKDERHSLEVARGVAAYTIGLSPTLVYYANGTMTKPALSWAGTDPVVVPGLECGHTFYWRLRVWDVRTDDEITSPWSETRAFTIKAGFKVTTPYYGPQLLSPDNGCGCPCDAPVCFSWSPFKETTKYKFELSENADMSSPLVSTTVPTTSYQYDGKVTCNTNYFWRVMSEEPAPSEWSAVFSFMTQAEPPAPAPEPEPPGTPIWVWVIIGIGAVLVIVTLVLIFKTRRV
jgi:hypothetical protein